MIIKIRFKKEKWYFFLSIDFVNRKHIWKTYFKPRINLLFGSFIIINFLYVDVRIYNFIPILYLFYYNFNNPWLGILNNYFNYLFLNQNTKIYKKKIKLFMIIEKIKKFSLKYVILFCKRFLVNLR